MRSSAAPRRCSIARVMSPARSAACAARSCASAASSCAVELRLQASDARSPAARAAVAALAARSAASRDRPGECPPHSRSSATRLLAASPRRRAATARRAAGSRASWAGAQSDPCGSLRTYRRHAGLSPFAKPHKHRVRDEGNRRQRRLCSLASVPSALSRQAESGNYASSRSARRAARIASRHGSPAPDAATRHTRALLHQHAPRLRTVVRGLRRLMTACGRPGDAGIGWCYRRAAVLVRRRRASLRSVSTSRS